MATSQKVETRSKFVGNPVSRTYGFHPLVPLKSQRKRLSSAIVGPLAQRLKVPFRAKEEKRE